MFGYMLCTKCTFQGKFLIWSNPLTPLPIELIKNTHLVTYLSRFILFHHCLNSKRFADSYPFLPTAEFYNAHAKTSVGFSNKCFII